MSGTEHPGSEALAAMQAGELDDLASARANVHVTECAQCRDRLAEIGRTRELLGSLVDPALPPDLQQRLLASIDAERAQLLARRAAAKERRRTLAERTRPYARSFLGAAAAAVVLALIVVGLSHLPTSRNSAGLATAERRTPGPGAQGGATASAPPGLPVFHVDGEVTPPGITRVLAGTPELKSLVASSAAATRSRGPETTSPTNGTTSSLRGAPLPADAGGVVAQRAEPSAVDGACIRRASTRPGLRPVALLDGTVRGGPAKVVVTVGGSAPRDVALWTFTPDCSRLLAFEEVAAASLGATP